MRQSTEDVIARHRAWLAKQGLPIKPRDTAAAAPAASAKPALEPLPVVIQPPRRPRPLPVPVAIIDLRTPDEKAWARLCQWQGTPIYDQAIRLLGQVTR